MLKIKLSRIGKKKAPMYRLIITEVGRDPYGRALEILGSYNPFSKDLQVKAERIKHWLSLGAQMTPTANNLLVTKGIVEGTKVKAAKVTKKRRAKIEADAKAAAKEKADKAAKEAEAKAAAEAAAKAAAEAAAAPAEEAAPEAPAEETPAEAPAETEVPVAE